MKTSRTLLRIGIAALLLSFSFSSLLCATEIAAEGTMARKLQRGFLNVALSPFEISHELSRDKSEESFIPTWATGLGKGTCFMVGRALVGVYEMVTFPVPFPSRYEPVVYPEFSWQHGESQGNS